MYKKIASNTLSQIFSKIITALISIVLIGILTKYLPIEMYGSYNKVYNYLGIFAFLADLGLYTIAVREISLEKDKKEKIIGNILTLRTILGLGIWIVAFLLAFLLPGYHDGLTLIAIFIIGAFTLVSLINSSLLALMQSQMKIEYSVVSLISGKLINLFLISCFLILIFTDVSQISYAFLSVFFSGFIGVLLNTYLNYKYSKRICDIRFLFDVEYIKYIFKLSLPYGIALFLSVVYFKIDIILLSILESPDKANVSIALYGLPMKIVEVLMVVGGFYLNSLLPTLTKKFKEKKHKDISNLLGLSLKILLSFGVLIFTLGNILAPEIIGIISTPEYISPVSHLFSSVDALRVVFGVLLFHFIALGFIYIFIASEKQSFLLKVNIVVTIFNIVGNIILIPKYSFLGAAIVTLLSQILLMIICACAFFKYYSIPKLYISHIFKSVILGGIMYVGFSYMKSYINMGDILTLFVIGISYIIVFVYIEYLNSKVLIHKKTNLLL